MAGTTLAAVAARPAMTMRIVTVARIERSEIRDRLFGFPGWRFAYLGYGRGPGCSSRSIRATDRQHHAPACFPIPNIVHRGREFLERIDLGRQRRELARRVPGENLLEAGGQVGGPALAIVADLQPGDLDVLHHQVIDLYRRDAARGEADHHHAAAPRHRAQRRVEGVAAEHVEHDVDAALLGEREHLRAQALVEVGYAKIDHRVGAGHDVLL